MMPGLTDSFGVSVTVTAKRISFITLAVQGCTHRG